MVRRRLLMLLIVLGCCAPTGEASPLRPRGIPPQGIRELFEQSELVLVGEVVDRLMGTAIIRPLEVVKGQGATDEVRVRVPDGVSCPAPPVYPRRARVLCFLARSDDEEWVTIAWSHGAKILGRDDGGVFVSRLRELRGIERIVDPQFANQELVEWYLRCTEHPATLLDALKDLDPQQWNGRPREDQSLTRSFRARHREGLLAVLRGFSLRGSRWNIEVKELMKLLSKTALPGSPYGQHLLLAEDEWHVRNLPRRVKALTFSLEAEDCCLREGLVRMERTLSTPDRPAFSVTLAVDGGLEFYGHWGTTVLGLRRGFVDPSVVTQLLATPGWLEHPEPTTHEGDFVKDPQTVTMTLQDGSRRRTISSSGTCSKLVGEMMAAVESVDPVARWIGGR